MESTGFFQYRFPQGVCGEETVIALPFSRKFWARKKAILKGLWNSLEDEVIIISRLSTLIIPTLV